MLNVSLLKKALKVSTLVAAFAVGSATMRADQVTFTGTAMGAFNGGAASNSATYNTLTYSGASFNTTTAPMTGTTASGFNYTGFTGLGGGGVNNFGTFTLPGTAATFNTPFELFLNFTSPGAINTNFTAAVMASVTSTGNGAAFVNFSPSSGIYSFANGTQKFELDLNNVTVNAGQTASVTGNFYTSAVTPEPMSLSLLGTGLVGIAFFAYRRMRNEEAASMPLAF